MNQKAERRTWVKINLDAIRENVRIINKILDGKSKIMAIVKADAYGHGATFVARELAECGVDFFGVSSIDEAMQLRENGITQNILILGYTNPSDENIKKLIKYNIIQTALDFDYVKEISEIVGHAALGASQNKNIKIHIKIDTGMNRIGFRYTAKNKDKDIIDKIKAIKNLNNIICEGIFTHFAVSDDKKSNFTLEQFNLFQELINSLEKENIFFDIKHAANSGATLNFKDTHLDYVRCGLILYGLYPSKSTAAEAETENTGLVPAMELKTIISQIHEVKQGETVSYGRTYKSGKDIFCATLPIGYADGFSRLLSNSASVIVNGRQVPVIGRICMDQSMIDVTQCENVKAGDTVTVFGYDEKSGEYISVDYVADMMETINYEVVCLIGKRVPRIFYKNGEETGQLNYIVKQPEDDNGL
ncbi:MAG: alanine racemase [Oscillospiraceae bacterium]|nr:alanine racemase [Oscillospiraceae bacterium]